MASTTTYDPLSTQAKSSWLAGLTEACNKLSAILNLSTNSFTDMQMSELYILPTDRYRIYMVPLGYKLWLPTPKPVIKKNGVEITESTDGFTIDYLGGTINFEDEYVLTENDIVTVSATYITNESQTINSITQNLSTLSSNVQHNKGYFSTELALNAGVPTGAAGDYAFVAENNSVYMWNATSQKWVNTYKPVDLSDYETSEEITALLNLKENKITPQGEGVSADSYYYGGRKTWQNLDEHVQSVNLTGLSLENTNLIEATDSIVIAFGKLQAQVKRFIHPLQGTGAPTTSTEGIVGQNYVNISNGDTYHLVSIDNGIYNWAKYADESYVTDSIDTISGDLDNLSNSVDTKLNNKQNKLTGTEGQIVGFNATGEAIALEGFKINYNALTRTLTISEV